MKFIYCVLICLSVLSLSCQKVQSIVESYPSIDGLQTSDLFQISVNGESIWTEKIRTDFDLDKLPRWFTEADYMNQQQEVHLTNFSCQGPIRVQIKVNTQIDSVHISPKSRNIFSKVNGNMLSFELPGPDKLYICVNNLPALCLIANPLETEIPDSTEKTVKYFGPGVHRPGMMHPESNTTIYIAGGAIVYGGIETDGESDIKVLGRGILDGEFKHRRMVMPKNSSNLIFDGIIIRRGRAWTNTIVNCDSVIYHNVKVISFRPGGDGINPLNSRDVMIDNCFLRCTDDCIAIKAPNETQFTRNIRVTNNTMIGYAFSDGVTIGFETNGPVMSDINVKNCDIIQARGGSRVDGHSAFSIICDGPALIHDVYYDNIRVESDVLKLFELHITDGTKYGINPPGNIRNIYLNNIEWSSERPIILKGFDSNHTVENIYFNQCRINGQLVTEARESVFQIGSFVKNVRFNE